MQGYRTVLEQKIRGMRLTLEEFANYAETFALEHGEPGTLSYRHLQRLVSGRNTQGQPIRSVRASTARLLERIFGAPIDELLSQPAEREGEPPDERTQSETAPAVAQTVQLQPSGAVQVVSGHGRSQLTASFAWLDERAGWSRETSRKQVTSKVASLDPGELLDRYARRSRIPRSEIAAALQDYYGATTADHGVYTARFGEHQLTTSIVTRREWLDLACALTPERDRLSLVAGEAETNPADLRHAVDRLAEAVALNVRLANEPLYQLLSVDIGSDGIAGTVTRVPFAEYALTMDLLEGELVDALADRRSIQPGELPLRDLYLPDLRSVLDVSGRLCAGGVPALCAIARPADPYRGGSDYALLIQERSSEVVNAARRLAVIPKGFHQPLTDARADARIGATLVRKMEDELFGRREVGMVTAGPRIAAPLHPSRLSEPMRWLSAEPGRMHTECTGFGLNLVSGNYEFACLIVIEDEEFWDRYGGQVEANWEASGLRLYSSRDAELISELIAEETWTNEGLFALLQGVRRLSELDGDRVELPVVETSALCRDPRGRSYWPGDVQPEKAQERIK